MFGPSTTDQNIASGQSSGDHEGTGFNPVGHDRKIHGLKFIHPFNGDAITASAVDMGPHGTESFGQIHDFGLTGGIF